MNATTEQLVSQLMRTSDLLDAERARTDRLTRQIAGMVASLDGAAELVTATTHLLTEWMDEGWDTSRADHSDLRSEMHAIGALLARARAIGEQA